jgi:hypothetical protein
MAEAGWMDAAVKGTPLRLVTIRQEGTEEAAVALPDGVALVREVYGVPGESPDLLSLLVSGRFYELKEAYDRGGIRGGTPFRSPPTSRLAS